MPPSYQTTQPIVIEGKRYKAGQPVDADVRPGVLESCLRMKQISPVEKPAKAKAPASTAESGDAGQQSETAPEGEPPASPPKSEKPKAPRKSPKKKS